MKVLRSLTEPRVVNNMLHKVFNEEPVTTLYSKMSPVFKCQYLPSLVIRETLWGEKNENT